MRMFVIRPKTGPRSRSVSFAQRRMTPQARRTQLAEVADLNQNDPEQLELQKWMDSHPEVQEPVGAKPVQMFGFRILRMTKAWADRLSVDMPGMDVAPDRPVSLIPPYDPDATVVSSPPSDLWYRQWVDFIVEGLSNRPGTGITVALLDTGVQADHVEFEGGRVTNACTFDPDVDAATPQRPSVDTAIRGHGTHVAGLICGRTVGIAPASRIVSGVVIPERQGLLSTTLLGAVWAAQQPEVQIAHLSFGRRGFDPYLRDAVQTLREVGLLVIAPIGNDGENMTCSPGNYPEVLSVGSLSEGFKPSSFSGNGRVVVDQHMISLPSTSAPGDRIYSCVPGGYQEKSGTSMAAPFCTGLACRLLENNPTMFVSDLSNEVIRLTKAWRFRQSPGPIS